MDLISLLTIYDLLIATLNLTFDHKACMCHLVNLIGSQHTEKEFVRDIDNDGSVQLVTLSANLLWTGSV